MIVLALPTRLVRRAGYRAAVEARDLTAVQARDPATVSPRAPVATVVRDASVTELVVASSRGDRAAFGTLYARFHRVVHAIALARVEPGDADDVVQETFAAAWLALEGLTEPAAFPGWITTLARHRAIDHVRRRRSARDREAATRDVAVSVALAVEPPRDEAAAALAAVRALPDAYRETLIMRLVEGLTGPEIAERTGMTPDSVRVHLHRGMKLLRAQLVRAGECP